MSTSTPHSTEEYYCTTCEDFINLDQVNKDWKCPSCTEYVNIKIITDTKDQSCFRVPVTELEKNDMVLIHRDDEYRNILGIIDLGTKLQLGLEKYGAYKIDKSKFILKLEGSWYH